VLSVRAMMQARLALFGLLVSSTLLPASGPAERRFHVEYATEIRVPAGTSTLAIWLPYPARDENQSVSNIQVDSPLELRIGKDGLENTIAHFEAAAPRSGTVPIKISVDVARREYVRKDFARASVTAGRRPAYLRAYLGSDELVPLNATVRELSAQVTAGKKKPLDKARAIYDHVVTSLKGDESVSAFLGLARAAGIPARFSIGFGLPSAKEGAIEGHRSWAEFWLDGYGWVPVGTWEAAEHPEKRDYFFGAHDANRVQLSTGRDLVLNPRQAGPPVNFFVYPYVEIDGKPSANYTTKLTFRELP
jgi:transglutaminase-like putative cysteine protease